METQSVIKLAKEKLDGEMESSARLCLNDAVALFNNGNLEVAKNRALQSLRYSVGIFHSAYKKAAK